MSHLTGIIQLVGSIIDLAVSVMGAIRERRRYEDSRYEPKHLRR